MAKKTTGSTSSTKTTPPVQPVAVPQKQVSQGTHERVFSTQELEIFKQMLLEERKKLLDKARHAVESGNIKLDKEEMYDEVDLASATVEQNLTFRLLDRDHKLLAEIDHALGKIDTGDFGYCEGTGEPIPKRRLELRPWCRHSVKYQEHIEKLKKSGRAPSEEDESFE